MKYSNINDNMIVRIRFFSFIYQIGKSIALEKMRRKNIFGSERKNNCLQLERIKRGGYWISVWEHITTVNVGDSKFIP